MWALMTGSARHALLLRGHSYEALLRPLRTASYAMGFAAGARGASHGHSFPRSRLDRVVPTRYVSCVLLLTGVPRLRWMEARPGTVGWFTRYRPVFVQLSSSFRSAFGEFPISFRAGALCRLAGMDSAGQLGTPCCICVWIFIVVRICSAGSTKTCVSQGIKGGNGTRGDPPRETINPL